MTYTIKRIGPYEYELLHNNIVTGKLLEMTTIQMNILLNALNTYDKTN